MAAGAGGLKKVLALCKRAGFIYSTPNVKTGEESSHGIKYGPLGAELKRNIVNEW